MFENIKLKIDEIKKEYQKRQISVDSKQKVSPKNKNIDHCEHRAFCAWLNSR